MRTLSKRLPALVLLVFAGSLPHLAWSRTNAHVPDWVRDAAHTPMPTLRPRDGAVILLDQIDITVDPAGHATVHRREAIKLLTIAGQRYADHPLFYDKGAHVHYLHSWTIGADEHEYQLDDKDVTDVTAVPDFAVFDSERVRIAHAVSAEPGAVIAFESEYVQEPFTTSWEYELDGMIPSAGRSIRLTLPAGFTYSTGWAHIAPIQPVQLSTSTWEWRIGPRRSMDDEDAAPAWGEMAARMMLAYAGPGGTPSDASWKNVGLWFENLSQGRAASTPEIQAKVAELTAGESGYVEKLLSITGFLQDHIRYVAVELGIGGWQPHAAADVFRNRYGDCKDKATLLIAMLADAGIAAHPLLVDFDHAIDPAMPSHYADHMIVAIELPAGVTDPRLQAIVPWGDKRLLIFDPTNPVSAVGSLEPELQGTWGLLVTGAASQPLQLPVLPAQDNRLVRTGVFTLGPDGSLSGDVSEVREGNTADLWRRLVLQGDTRKLEEREEQNVRSSLADFTLSDLNTEHAHDRSQPLDVRFHVTAEHYAKHAGQMLLVRPSVVGAYAAQAPEDGKPRLYPIALGAEEDLREEYTIVLPAGYQADDLPDPVKLQAPFASFENTVRLDGNKLRYTRELAIHALEIRAADDAEYQQFFGAVANAERSEAILKPSP